MNEQTKQCSRCKEFKNLTTEFHKTKHNKCGYLAGCINCISKARKAKYIPKRIKNYKLDELGNLISKFCGKCKLWKLPEEFYLNKYDSNHGLQSACTPCKQTPTFKEHRNARNRTEKYRTYNRNKAIRYRANFPTNYTYQKTKARAKKFNIPFEIDMKYIESIWPIDNKCPILLKEFTHGRKCLQTNASVDRHDPKFGYIPGNISIISYKANTMKSNTSDFNIFKNLGDLLSKYHER